MHGYEVVGSILNGAGVNAVFQYMAEDTMELASTLEKAHPSISVIHSRHEQGAMAMADAYSRAGNEIGVCIVGRGPGIAQTGTALLNARKNGSRLLVIVPLPGHGHIDDPKAFDQTMYLQSTVGDPLTVRSNETLGMVLTEALRKLSLGSGPQAVQIPTTILKDDIAYDPERHSLPAELSSKTTHRRAPTRMGAAQSPGIRAEPDPTQIDAAVNAYLESDAFTPPVIVVGDGAAAANAKTPIAALAERINAILVTSLKGRALFEDHPFAVGFGGNWGSPLANKFLTEANYVLAIGCSLNHYTVDRGSLITDDATVVHVDANPHSIGQYTPVDIGIVADANAASTALEDAFAEADIDRGTELWTDALKQRISAYSPLDERDYPPKDDVLDPRDLMRALEEILPTDRLLGTDGGQFRKWALHELTGGPSDSIISCDFAAIGLGLPMGVGLGQYVKDRPTDNRTAVAICGDGGVLMSIQELETAVREEIPLVVIVGNDQSLGSEYHYLAVQGDDPTVALLETPSIAEVAESFGAEGHRIHRIDELEAIIDRLTNPSQPVVVECMIDPEVRHHSY